MTAIADHPLPLAASREPGVYPDISLEDYHADPTTLSSSGARKLLAPSCPAKFRYWQQNQEPRQLHFDIGTIAHTLLLGEGPQVHVADYDSWRTKDAQLEKSAAEEAGAIPILASQYEDIEAMVRVAREHPIAGALFAPGSGKAEQSLYWLHRGTGVTLRCRPDWLRGDQVVDYKTCASADLDSIQRDVARYGYHVQDAWYRAGFKALFGVQPKFRFVFQEKQAPYLITVIELDPVALEIGQRLAEMAIWSYAECTASGVWPDYQAMAQADPFLPEVALPAWVEREYR